MIGHQKIKHTKLKQVSLGALAFVIALSSTLVLLSSANKNPVLAVTSDDVTSAEAAAERNAEAWCDSQDISGSNGMEVCKKHYMEGYLGDACSQAAGTQIDMCGAGASERKKDFLASPRQLCSSYVNTGQGKKGAPKWLKDLKGNQKSAAINACATGFEYGISGQSGQAPCTQRYSGSFRYDACVEGTRIANLHIFTIAEVEAHALGKRVNAANNPDEEDENLADCDAKLSSVLSWILCPIIDMASGTSDFVYQEIIKPLLDDSPVSTKAEGKGSGPYQAWQGFRFLANVILVGAMLVLVYGMARGGGN